MTDKAKTLTAGGVMLAVQSVAVAEIVALALFAVAITMPALTITYRMGP